MMEVLFEEAVDKLAAVLEAHGCPPAQARLLANNCVSAQRDGSASHGLFRLKDYVSTLASGYVSGNPTPLVEDSAPGFVRVDGDNGFAQVALHEAKELLVQKARANGIAILAIRNTHHLGALYLDVEAFAKEGLVALAVVNSDLFVAPPGATRAVFGTNPLAFAAPRTSGPPVVFDQSASTMAHGDLQVAALDGRRLPDNTGIDAEGRASGDPTAILAGGALSTAGGHKGASIALMVEILCAALVGASFSHEAPHDRPQGASTVRTGETIIVIDPATGGEGLPGFENRVEALAAALVEAGQTRIPGERAVARRRRFGDMVPVEGRQWAELERLFAAVGGAVSLSDA